MQNLLFDVRTKTWYGKALELVIAYVANRSREKIDNSVLKILVTLVGVCECDVSVKFSARWRKKVHIAWSTARLVAVACLVLLHIAQWACGGLDLLKMVCLYRVHILCKSKLMTCPNYTKKIKFIKITESKTFIFIILSLIFFSLPFTLYLSLYFIQDLCFYILLVVHFPIRKVIYSDTFVQ